MADPPRPADFSALRSEPLGRRPNKIDRRQFGQPVQAAGTLQAFLDGLPDVLAVRQLRGLARRVRRAREASRPVIWALGGHVIKVGLAPVLAQMIDNGRISALALNGAAAIHDWEVAAIGGTSEDVAAGLATGRFGMSRETGAALNAASAEAARSGRGLGEVLGRRILDAKLPHRDASLLACCAQRGIPVTVHVAIGCDVVHTHADADGAAIGAATFVDFRRLVSLVGELAGGVWINCGSAVQLPEVFLKALSAARNLGHVVEPFTTADLDMVRHYRTEENVLRRPTAAGGEGYRLLGHHEINLPLLAAAIELDAAEGC